MEFMPGNNVRLKSSLTRMTVEAVDGDDISCIWLHNGELGRAILPSIALALAPQDPREEIRKWLSEEKSD